MKKIPFSRAFGVFKKPNGKHKVAMVLGMLGTALSLPASALAAPPSPLTPASTIAQVAANQFWLVMGIGTVVFVLVEALLVFAIVRYRRRSDDDAPKQIHGNATLEIAWTIVPAIICLSLFGVTLRGLQVEDDIPADATVIQVTGYQWFWGFDYVENGTKRTSLQDDLYIPEGEPVIFEITSNDVIHSYWIPELAGKMDAIPGKTNTVWVVAEEGTYAGQCAEFCGVEHFAMLFDVHAVPREEYDAKIAEYIEEDANFIPVGTDMSNPQPDGVMPPGNASAGELLYTELGCNSCHTTDGTALVGPSFQGIATRAGSRIPGTPAEEYLHESIVLPCEYVVSGFQCVMPQTYGTESLEAQDLADLTAWLLTLE